MDLKLVKSKDRNRHYRVEGHDAAVWRTRAFNRWAKTTRQSRYWGWHAEFQSMRSPMIYRTRREALEWVKRWITTWKQRGGYPEGI